jgi:eukaryotic-like serine/threonine-protein kinase
MWTLDGRYRLDARIGSGATAEVWRGHDVLLDRPVAVKLYTRSGDRDGRGEARAAARLTHPHVARVYDVGSVRTDDGTHRGYLVMEYIDGPTLAHEIAAGGGMPWRRVARIGVEICAGLTAAHAQGLVHHDIKPSNVMLGASGAKIVDFGTVVTPAADGPSDEVVVGALAYLAPERLAGESAGPAIDVYAAGVLLYECLTGRLPWPAQYRHGMLDAKLHGTPATVPMRTGLPAGLGALIERCLDRDPGRRPTSRELAVRLGASVGVDVGVPAVDPAAFTVRLRPSDATAVLDAGARRGSDRVARGRTVAALISK